MDTITLLSEADATRVLREAKRCTIIEHNGITQCTHPQRDVNITKLPDIWAESDQKMYAVEDYVGYIFLTYSAGGYCRYLIRV